MKRTIIVAACVFSGINSFAQGMYGRVGLGLALPQAGQTINGGGSPYSGTNNNNTGSYDIKSASFTSGLSGYLGIGYMRTKHIGIELNANLGLWQQKYSYSISNVLLQGVPSSVTITHQAVLPVIISPSLLLQTDGSKYNIYARFGLALPLKTNIEQHVIQRNDPGTGLATTNDFTFTIKNNFSVGFTGAAGVHYRLNKMMSIWGEVSMLSLAPYAKKADLTAVTSNGVNYSVAMVTGLTNITYTKSGTADSTGTVQPTYSQPFSNVGFNFGVCFQLSSKKEKEEVRLNKAGNRPKAGSFR
jgi:hypothetical protein